ncbi:DUF1398 domain-containing protein [Undibacterium sp. TJN19]|uniref:DUF1398 domain-containing protein n=1 Tax=Undibacterium sp. TJN19 TaxID=3413055 RepID=UPI003BF0C177
MENTVSETITQCAQASYAGTMSFGAIVGKLMVAGVESYHADYRHADTTYYLPDGETMVIALHAPAIPVAENFDTAALQAAIRGAQAGAVKYPEFLQLSMAAGCVGYLVWINGRHVIYFGRRGETHVEHFPAAS